LASASLEYEQLSFFFDPTVTAFKVTIFVSKYLSLSLNTCLQVKSIGLREAN